MSLFVRPFPLEAGHPANHGYTACAHCGVQRPAHCLGPFSRACLLGCAPQTVTGNHLVAPPKTEEGKDG